MMRSLNNKSYGYQIVKDVTGLAPTKLIERFEVRPGDCTAQYGYDDCENDRERSELSQKKDSYIINGSTEWYGWYIFVPKGHKFLGPTKVYMGQFHQKGAKPAWMFVNHKGGYWLDNHVGKKYKFAELLDKKELIGKWNRIEINAKWSDEEDGFFKVWVNGKLKCDFVGVTASVSRLYFKYGLYRTYISRYKSMLLGFWLAKKLGLPKSQHGSYVKKVVFADFEEPGDEDIMRKVMKDIAQHEADITDSEIRLKLDEFHKKRKNGKHPPAQVVYYTLVKRGNSRESIQ